MPKYKPSLGDITITTPHPSFANYIREELENHRVWNPKYIARIGNIFVFKPTATTELWRIQVTTNGIRVRSKEPVVYLRHGIKIFMGSSRIEIS